MCFILDDFLEESQVYDGNWWYNSYFDEDKSLVGSNAKHSVNRL